MRVRNATFIALAAVAIVATVLSFGQPSDQGSPPVGLPSPSAAPPTDAPLAPLTDTAVGNPPGQERGPSGDDPKPAAPPPAVTTPLIAAPLPATGYRDGAVVGGFPSVISLAPRSEVMFNSVATEGDRVQVGLDAMSISAPDEVLAHYRSVFAGLDLVAEPVSTADGSSAVAFERGPSTITDTVWSTDSGSRYTVFSVLVAGI